MKSPRDAVPLGDSLVRALSGPGDGRLTGDDGGLRVVLDTNVVLSFWHFRHPRMLGLLAWLELRRAVLLTRGDCLDELTRVLAFSDFGIAPERRAEIFADYSARTERLDGPGAVAATLPRCKDLDDQKFLELAWEGGAHLLLTRDKLLLAMARLAPWRESTLIATPERWLKLIDGPARG
jgi:predicted nucleic acid-binding protein